jgi:hypothetical protein
MAQTILSKPHPEVATQTGVLSLSQAALLLFGLMSTTLLGCWYAGYRLGVDRHVVTNFYWLMFIIAYGVALYLPWLDLKGQEGLDRSQRMEKMCIVWIFLTVLPHLTWELPWVVFYDQIMAGKDQLWAYQWWTYMDGGDMRYVTRDVYLLAMEVGASTIGILAAITLWRRRSQTEFTPNQLLLIMALMVADFYPTYMYYATEIYQGFPSVGTTADLVLKFIGANIYWLIMPWVVFVWAGRQLASRSPNLAPSK